MRRLGTTPPSVSDTPEKDERAASRGGHVILDRILGKSVPAWAVAGLILVFLIAIVGFASYVKTSVERADESPMASAAIAVASFPPTVGRVFREIGRMLRNDVDYTNVAAYPSEDRWSEFSPVVSKLESGPSGLIVRRGVHPPARGWRIIVGTFRADQTIQHAAVLLSPELEIVHSWPLTEDEAPVERPPWLISPHGFTMLPDGSVIYAFDRGVTLHRKDWCGRTVWAIPGRYSHVVEPDDERTTIWTTISAGIEDPKENRIVQVAADDGRILKDFSIADIIAANPDLDILELRRLHPNFLTTNAKGRPGRWAGDPFHLNDVEPLPGNLASSFPMFSPGDLLISARETNLVFVVDPSTLAIKWWRIGATIRQHDPDWSANGRVSVYNNRMARDYSEIVEIDPVTFARTVAVDGRSIDFYSRIRGKHQAIPGGGQLITSSQQGRTIELTAEGEIAAEFYIVLREDGPIFGVISESIFLPEEAIDLGALRCSKS
jgi:hypothetical protein